MSFRRDVARAAPVTAGAGANGARAAATWTAGMRGSARLAGAAAAATCAALVAVVLWRRLSRRRVRKPSEDSRLVAEVVVPRALSGKSLEALLLSTMPREFPSRSVVKQAVKRASLLLDGRPCTSTAQTVRGGSVCQYMCGAPRPHLAALHDVASSSAAAAAPWLHVVHEDEWLAVIVKPIGIAVQGDASAAALRRAANRRFPPPHRPDALTHPHHVHRLDKARKADTPHARGRAHSDRADLSERAAIVSQGTGGLLVYARTAAARTTLCSVFVSGAAAKVTRVGRHVARHARTRPADAAAPSSKHSRALRRRTSPSWSARSAARGPSTCHSATSRRDRTGARASRRARPRRDGSHL